MYMRKVRELLRKLFVDQLCFRVMQRKKSRPEYHKQLVAFLPFGIILLQYFGKFRYPFHIPGGFLSIAAGTGIAWLSGYWGKPMMNGEVLSKSFEQAGLFLPSLTVTDLFDVFTLKNIKNIPLLFCQWVCLM